jgi:hypothetical protein
MKEGCKDKYKGHDLPGWSIEEEEKESLQKPKRNIYKNRNKEKKRKHKNQKNKTRRNKKTTTIDG